MCDHNSTMAALCNRQDLYDFDGDGLVGAEEAAVAYFGVDAWARAECVHSLVRSFVHSFVCSLVRWC